MNFKRDPSNINFMEFVAKWSSFFCIIPWYNFRKNRLIAKTAFKTYAILLTLFLTSLHVALIYVQHKVLLKHIKDSLKILFYLVQTNMFLFWASAGLGTAFWNMPAWRRFLRLSRRLEIDNCLLIRKKTKGSVVTNNNFIFILGNLHVFFTYFIYILMWKTVDFEKMAFSTYELLHHYLEFLFSSIVIGIVVSIKYKYGVVNETVTNLKERGRRTDVLLIIKKTKLSFLATGEIVSEFNALFGWPILFVLAHLTLDMLNAVVDVLVISKHSTVRPLLIFSFYKFLSKVRNLLDFSFA